ncbi:hypothetical protein P691DRAFT_344387 [Macrolepiota fuliginosa MF-IS2]|uniref:Uncharacterized protein n=1 Tax=Macrolepiota fuliginosa MF-IS2 TaxID=1400762 RepID=A0A9P5X7W3_9AGAR|nr:hypothetical protein P691DRAFT_344387 [Macrolepiota fuliginosa MF-IS2]
MHPLSELDLFYILIMRCVPSGVLPRILAIFLLMFYIRIEHLWEGRPFWNPPPIIRIANIIGLSEAQFRNVCGFLQSVLELVSSPGQQMGPPALGIKFYHASFMDFLQDPSRSGEFCIFTRLDSLRLELLRRLNDIHSCSTGESTVATSSSPNVHTSFKVLQKIQFTLVSHGPSQSSKVTRSMTFWLMCFFLFGNGMVIPWTP